MSAGERSIDVRSITLEHPHSDTAGPLSAAALSNVGESIPSQLHGATQYSIGLDDARQDCSSTPGSAVSRRSPRIASSGRSSGASTGFRPNGHAAGRPAEASWRLGARRHGRHRRVLHAAADDATTELERGADGDSASTLTFPSAFATPHPENNTVYVRLFPGAAPAERDRGRGARAAAVERRRRRTRRAVPAAGVERHERAAAQPAVPRPADAARTPPRRLHRQLERRAHAAGVPAGGARRATRDRVARARRATSASGSSAPASARASRC